MSFVDIIKVAKSYHGQKVLKDISISIQEGEFVTFLGPSGCGKSTLLRAVAGLNDIDAGTIMVAGKDITPLPPRDRRVGMVFQSYALFPNMNVYDNIAFGLKMEGIKKEEIRRQVAEMIGIVDLKGKEHQYPSQLSGGQQQRVALARALVKKPRILLLDEPLSALDAKIRRTLRNEIRSLQRKLNMTTIFVTHDQEEALTVSDRIFVMRQGEIEQAGTPHDIYTSPRTEFVARFIGHYNVWSGEDAAACFAGMDSKPGVLYAVRPEIIRLEAADEKADEPAALPTDANDGTSLIGTGTVAHATVLGNIIRFEVHAGNLRISVDMLHDAAVHALPSGSSVRLRVPRQELKELRSD